MKIPAILACLMRWLTKMGGCIFQRIAASRRMKKTG